MSQEVQAAAHQRQTDSLAQFQTHVMEVMERVAQPAQIVMPVRGRDPNEIFGKFIKRGLPEFYGTEDPLRADEWIMRLEKIFSVFKCSGRQRV